MEGGKGHMGKFPSKPLFLPHFLPNLGRKQNNPKWWAQGEITHAPTKINSPNQTGPWTWKKNTRKSSDKKKCAYSMANGKSMENIFCKSNVMTWKDFLRDKKKLQGQMFYNKDPQQPPHSPNIITTFKSKHHCWSNARSIEL